MSSTIPAKLVKELRDKTGVGFSRCKQALVESNGEMENAIDWLRQKGEGVAKGKSSRAASQGSITFLAGDQACVLLEVNCETDSVSRLQEFKEYTATLLTIIAEHRPRNVAELMRLEIDGKSLENTRRDMVLRIGENIQVRRFIILSPQYTHCYIHGGQLAGVVRLNLDNPELGHDLAMQVVASQPRYIAMSDIPGEVYDKERDLIADSMSDSKKPEEIKQKIIQGKLNKQLGAQVLEEQEYLKDNQLTVKQLLEKRQAQVIQFHLWRCGEGVEKNETDFAAEVQQQVEQYSRPK